MIFEKMQQAIGGLLSQIYSLPFNCELAQGTLDKEKFIFYLKQDSLYLADFSRALAMSAVKLPDRGHARQFMQFSAEALQAERDLHQHWLAAYQISFVDDWEQSPACFSYTNYLLKMASMAPVEEAVASLLPCFWVYREIGQQLAKQVKNLSINPYRTWIELYSGEAFALSVNAAIQVTNELGENVNSTTEQKMLAAFKRSTQLEWLFWDSAFRQEKWHLMENEEFRKSLPPQGEG